MQKFEKAGYKLMLFIIVTNDEAFIFVKTYACYYLFLVHWRITRHAFYLNRLMKSKSETAYLVH